MKRPTAASLKRVTPENLALLGMERVAALLVEVAEGRPDLKRRLRMELAAEQGSDHLAAEIDKRLLAIESSRARISWRARPAFIRELDALRLLTTERLGALDPHAALTRSLAFMALARRVYGRMKDQDDLDGVFDRAALALGELLGRSAIDKAEASLAEAIALQPQRWSQWLPRLDLSAELAARTLPILVAQSGSGPVWLSLTRQLAEAAGDLDTLIATYSAAALQTPSVAAEIGARLLKAGRIEQAGDILGGARPAKPKARAWIGAAKMPEPDFEWESVWIDYLDRSGQVEAAQAARWASFERTLSAERARAFTRRLTGFDDVEAETRAFELAARHPDFEVGLRFLMDWPSFSDAARMIQARGGELTVTSEEVELWAGRLAGRYPAAAETLLRKAAALALRRRDMTLCDRLTQEADAIAG